MSCYQRLGEPRDEDEIQKIAATIEEETDICWKTVIMKLGKTYPVGHVHNTGKQKKIVKFTSHYLK